MVTEVLAKAIWSYTLERRDSRFVLSVVCGGTGLYEVEAELTPELAHTCMTDERAASSLANKIRGNPEQFRHNLVCEI